MVKTTFNDKSQVFVEEMNEGQELSNCTVLCGSFNPVHIGHYRLAKATHEQQENKGELVFEIALKNADKG